MDPGPNGTNITRLGRNTKRLPTITLVQNLRGYMDILTNQKALEHCLGYMEPQELYSTLHQRPHKNGNYSSHQQKSLSKL